MRMILLGGLAAIGLLPLVAHAATPVSAKDRAFIASVSQGGMFEVKAGKLAEHQGSLQDIRDQGNTEAHDHTLVGAKLKKIASAAGVSFPDTLNASFTSEYDALKAKSGTDFDSLYLEDMETIHAKDGAAFDTESQDGTDPELKAFAAETYRIVQRHIGELKAAPATGQ